MEVEVAKLSSLTYLYCITEHNNIAYNVQFKQIQAMQTHYTTLRHLASMMAARAVPCVIEHFPDGPASGHWIAQSNLFMLPAPFSTFAVSSRSL